MVMVLERREVVYRGRVQGVGFRYTVRELASRYQVAGYVRNLDDGRVQIEIEGEAAELDKFLADVAGRMADFIRAAAVDRRTGTGEFAGFEIR